MRWQTGRRSNNVEDRRDGDSEGNSQRRGMKLGWKSTLAIVVIAVLTGQDPMKWLGIVGGLSENIPATQTVSKSKKAPPKEEQQAADFVSVVLADTEDTWSELLPKYGLQYEQPKLVYLRMKCVRLVVYLLRQQGLFIVLRIEKFT